MEQARFFYIMWKNGATTLSITTFSIMTFSKNAYSTTLKHEWHSAQQQPAIMLSVTIYLLLCWVSLCWVTLAECRYAAWRYAECRYAECRGTEKTTLTMGKWCTAVSITTFTINDFIFMPSINNSQRLSIRTLSTRIECHFDECRISIVGRNVIMLNVIILSVAAPPTRPVTSHTSLDGRLSCAYLGSLVKVTINSVQGTCYMILWVR